MNNFSKAQKNVKNDMLILGIIQVIIVILSLVSDNFTIQNVLFAGALIAGYDSACKGTKTAGTIGIIVGILMILTILLGDIIDCLLGIFVLSHSLKYNKCFKK